ARIVKVAGGDAAIERSVLELYMTDAEQRIAALKQEIDAGDLERGRITAHSLKGASGNVGCAAMQRKAFEIEEHAAAGRRGEAGALLPELDRLFLQTRALLFAFLADHTG
ncbi:MAG: Hpt domain-containing protein, partial [Candidatus Hydrogenedentes bacterium]|nr:Hpt domain-containing protein [Candidatus Hydrogenedentota bacterium]